MSTNPTSRPPAAFPSHPATLLAPSPSSSARNEPRAATSPSEERSRPEGPRLIHLDDLEHERQESLRRLRAIFDENSWDWPGDDTPLHEIITLYDMRVMRAFLELTSRKGPCS